VIQSDCFHPDEYLTGRQRWKTLDVDLKNIRGAGSPRIRHASFHGTIGHAV
jgi:hypothetical protein